MNIDGNYNEMVFSWENNYVNDYDFDFFLVFDFFTMNMYVNQVK